MYLNKPYKSSEENKKKHIKWIYKQNRFAIVIKVKINWRKIELKYAIQNN